MCIMKFWLVLIFSSYDLPHVWSGVLLLDLIIFLCADWIPRILQVAGFYKLLYMGMPAIKRRRLYTILSSRDTENPKI